MSYQRRARFTEQDSLEQVKSKLDNEFVQLERVISQLSRVSEEGRFLLLRSSDGAVRIPVDELVFDVSEGFRVSVVAPKIGRVRVDLPTTQPLPVPNDIGVVLYAKSAEEFTIERPLTGPSGWLVNNDGILLVV
jgi:hypothetical protein